MNNSKVTIIIPVYNVEEYIQQCLDSVIGQTYCNLEIICVDDASKDNSINILNEYKEKDFRIKVVEHHTNKGLGETRNDAMKYITGDYMFFLDSDDWLPIDAIDKLVNEMDRSQADFCVGAMSHYNQQTNEYTVGWRDVDEAVAIGTYTNWSMCNKLFRVKFYLDNEIMQYSGLYEDAASYPIIQKLANKISLLHEVTYYYRRFTGKSIMDNWKNALRCPESIEFMLQQFIKRNISIQDCKLFDGAMALARDSYAQLKKSYADCLCDKQVLDGLEDKLNEIFSAYFGKYGYGSILVHGSSSLNQIYRRMALNYLPNSVDVPLYNFSSIISTMSPVEETYAVFHEKIFRKNMVEKDLNKTFSKIDLNQFNFILIDCIDERNDILEMGGTFYTYSEAMVESFIDNNIKKSGIICRGSAICEELWFEKAKLFTRYINNCVNCKPIIIKLFLTTEYGDMHSRKRWKGLDQIENINNLLKKYYKYLEENLENVIIIEVDRNLLFTDEKYRYGCYPWNYNQYMYFSISDKVESVMLGGNIE